jgi:Rieske Fe-S protein
VVRHHGRLYAVYREPAGTLVWRSAVCPHLLGVVRWNSLERSWDCPCHGSRFDCQGRVVNGPANSDLTQVPDPRNQNEPERVWAADAAIPHMP